MHKVITMSDRNYFEAGKLFLETRSRVIGDFTLYGPDLTGEQISILDKHNIEYVRISKSLYETHMQFLKFRKIQLEIMDDWKRLYGGFTFVDFDTFFINDWYHVFDYDFDLGITLRKRLVENEPWSYVNGGVIFARPSAYGFIQKAKSIIKAGKSDELPEYDTIWNLLENNRRPSKTHYRTELRWWVDQVFLSALVSRYLGEHGNYQHGRAPAIFDFQGVKIALFSCNHYNVLNSKPVVTNESDVFIRHLKSAGRKAMGMEYKIREKL